MKSMLALQIGMIRATRDVILMMPLVKRYSPVWHHPQGALTFLTDDLARNVGTSGRPVVLPSHCGFDTDWWHTNDW
jgi:hypothetical protein